MCVLLSYFFHTECGKTAFAESEKIVFYIWVNVIYQEQEYKGGFLFKKTNIIKFSI